MTADGDDAAAVEPVPVEAVAAGPSELLVVVVVLVVGLAAGAVLMALLRGDGDSGGDARAVEATTTTIEPTVQYVVALRDAGVPEPVAACALGTVADGGPAAVTAAAVAPLAAGSPSREAVAACALDHLAAAVQDGAGIDGAAAQCVAGGVIDRVGLEAVLVSIGALAVTAEVAAAAEESATTCAAAG